MKQRYTSKLQMFHVTFVVTLLLLTSQVSNAQVVFTQDFPYGNVTTSGTYWAATPSTNQFNAITEIGRAHV